MMIFHGVVTDVRRPGAAHRVATDLGGSRSPVVSIDTPDQHLGAAANHRRVLSLLWREYALWTEDGHRDPDVWFTVLEDDAVLCDDFRSRETRALSRIGAIRPIPLVSWYLGTGRWAGQFTKSHAEVVHQLITDAEVNHREWIPAQDLWHAVAYSLPAPAALDLLRTPPGPGSTEETITGWARAHLTPVFYAHPSLVDHRDAARLIPASARDTPVVERRAWSFVGRSGWRDPGLLH